MIPADLPAMALAAKWGILQFWEELLSDHDTETISGHDDDNYWGVRRENNELEVLGVLWSTLCLEIKHQ